MTHSGRGRRTARFNFTTSSRDRPTRRARMAVLDPARHVPTGERPEAVTGLLLEHLAG